MRPEDLSALQLDALQELGNIGAGHAATALSQLVDLPVSIEVPTAYLVPVDDVPTAFGGPETLTGAVFSRLLGDVGGSILFVAPREAMLGLVDLLRAREPGRTKTMGAEEATLATHAASLLMSSYLAAIARMTDLNLIPSQPRYAFDMLGGILDAVVVEVGMRSAHAIVVMNRFSAENVSVDAALFYIPDPDSLEVLLGRLGIA